MIYTVTLNPAVDYFLTMEDGLMVDEVNRGSNDVFRAGGKGLNVSWDLALMGVPSVAVALLGGFTGSFIAESFGAREGIDLRRVEVPGCNRINVKAHYDRKALCINGEGPTAPPGTTARVLDALDGVAPGDWVMVCGSMMKGIQMDTVEAVADLAHSRGAGLVMDMESVTTDDLRRCRPDLIKPNLYEFGLLLGRGDLTPAGLPEAMAGLRSQGLENLNVLCSLGREGAALLYGEAFYRMGQPDTDLVNKVGCGDAMLAAFVGRLSRGDDPAGALRWAGAAGNARAATLGELTLEQVKGFLDQMRVEKSA